jgi:hypothetical protein
MNFSAVWLLVLGVGLLKAPSVSGIKWTVQFQQSGNSNEHTYYMAEDRKRMEVRGAAGSKNGNGTLQVHYGPLVAVITRCDLGEVFELNLDACEYTSALYPPKAVYQGTDESARARTG